MLIVIAGSPGAGKTTLAGKLSDYLNAYFKDVVINIEIDLIRGFVKGDALHFDEKDSIWFDLTLNLIEQARKHCNFIVVEGLFYDSACFEALKNIDESVVFIRLMASLDTCLKRNKNRLKVLPDKEIIELFNIERPDYLYEISSDDTIENTLIKTLEFLGVNAPNGIAEN